MPPKPAVDPRLVLRSPRSGVLGTPHSETRPTCTPPPAPGQITTLTSPTRLVMRSRSRYSSSGIAYLRETA